MAGDFLGLVVEEAQKAAYARRVPRGQDEPLRPRPVAMEEEGKKEGRGRDRMVI